MHHYWKSLRSNLIAGPLAAALLLTACGSAEPVVPVPPPSASAPAPTTPAPEPFDLAAALALVEREGFTPTPPEAELAGPLRAIHSICTGTANGRCQQVFFFDGNRLAGTVAAGLIEITGQDGQVVRLSFPRYQPGDPGCCPTGAPGVHEVRLGAGGIVATPPIPEAPNATAASG
ncbi:hypothetical protein GCM10011581_30830 [Saccharopolyspora subtropica]|uniref:LppP/LprE lipoprotein n=1 Tax=Saccharopolyspora thermophila TaxID=89367 RepID=A0A917K0R6_9PSEU|nr:LppP/LprE family lipoprotein [Saccharopolyspora subtropica]GGI91585.1 hypothetical protein GCM10011581_30830 [Saccharopolyspora subtropica]